MVSSQYFTVLDRVSYSCTLKRSWLSLWLGLAVSIFQFWIIHRTVRKKDFVALARVGFSSQYFQFGIVYHTVRRQDVLALARVRVDSISQFWIVYHTVAQERYRGSLYG